MRTSGIGSPYGAFNYGPNASMDSDASMNAIQREKVHNLKKLASNIGKDAIDGKPVWQNTSKNTTLNSLKSYSETLRSQRTKAQDTTRSLKSLKYQYKNISSKILRSKTSTAAKQAAGQARREIIRLNRAKMDKNADTEELNAAIAHAKSMERIAKKKARHLQEEELAQASITNRVDSNTTSKMDSTVNSAEQFADSDSDLYNNSYDDSDIDSYYETNVQESENWESASADLGYVESVESMMMDMSNLSELIDMSDALSMQNMVELMEDFDESMQDMLEDMGLDELADTMLSVRKDITPEELKEVKVKHRNREMKDMVKADADYLKFIFDKLQKGGGTSLSQSATIQQPSSTPQMSSASEVSLGIAMSTNQAAMPSIDVLL